MSGAAGAALVGAIAPAAALAQDNSTIGPPQLRDFQLPGQRTNAPPRPAGPIDTSPNAAPPTAPRQAPPRAAPAPAPRAPASPPPASSAPPQPAPAARTNAAERAQREAPRGSAPP